MSCQLRTCTQFQDLQSVKSYLFPDLDFTVDKQVQLGVKEQDTAKEEDAWTDDWDWQTDETTDDVVEIQTVDETKDSCLQDVIISLSPTNDLMALARIDRICFLTQKWDPRNKSETETKYCVTWQAVITNEPGESITSVLCIPLASHKRSTQGGPDWTCTVVAFSSGYLRVYTETGTLLMSQLLHDEPVLSVKCKTYGAPRYLGLAEQQEEMVILYKKTLVTIDGFSFYQSLRACRNQVARAAAGGSDLSVHAPPLAYKKWGLQGQDNIFDHDSCGIHTTCPFDQMVNASVLGGFSSHITPTPPAAACYLTAGVGPYLACYYAIEGSSQPLLSEVAYAVASKLKSALLSAASGWLNFAPKTQKDEQIKEMTALPMRFGLPDKRRTGEKILLSPSNNFAAVTDSFGRVTLVDVDRGVAVRMWKGYRDAQIAWYEARETDHNHTSHTSTNRIAQFLIVYAPRRGILEVWTAANGARVAAFNTSKSCILLPLTYGIMGLNNVTVKSVKGPLFQCVLIDPDGTIKTIDVPFHLALGYKNSMRSRDLHLLKKVKTLLKDNSEESDKLKGEIISSVLDMKIASIIQQAIEKLLSTRYVSGEFMKAVIDQVITHLTIHGLMDVDGRLLAQFCHHQGALISTYITLTTFNNSASTQHTDVDDIAENLSTRTSIPMSECEQLISTITQYNDHLRTCDQRRVHFHDHPDQQLVPFLACFYCHLHRTSTSSQHASAVNLAKEITLENQLALGNLCFLSCFEGRACADDLIPVLQSFSLPVDQLMDLLMSTWLSQDGRHVTGLVNLHKLFKSLTSMADSSEVVVDHAAVSPWWQKRRDACSQSQNIGSALLAAVVCRNLARSLIQHHSQPKDMDADTDHTEQSDWESISVDTEAWNTIVHQLEDTLTINSLLQLRVTPGSDETQNMVVMDRGTVWVNKLLRGGKGIVPEVVAKHIVWCGLSAATLLPPTHTSPDSPHPDNSIAQAVQTVRARFPYSLDNNVLTANCCWEFAVQWNKDREVIQNLVTSLGYLELVDNGVMRQGLCSLLWHMFIVKPFSALASLMDKVAKMPKERLCRKEVGMSEQTSIKFMDCCVKLLETTMDANCDVQNPPVLHIEPNWQHTHGTASLVELVVDQMATNYALVRHHYHLAVAMNAVAQLSLKSAKVMSLFDNRGRQCFFSDLNTHPLLPSHKHASDVHPIRTKFLNKILAQTVLLGKRETDMSSVWPRFVQELANDFGLEGDTFKRYHVCELYRAGQERQAEEVLSTVSDHETMGQELLVIAGQRVSGLVYNGENAGMFEALTATSTSLSTWLRQRHTDGKDLNNASLDDTLVLVHQVLKELGESSKDYTLAVSLAEFLQALKS